MPLTEYMLLTAGGLFCIGALVTGLAAWYERHAADRRAAERAASEAL